MSLYSIKQAGGGGVQPWASALAVGKALKDFYTSLGDVTLTGANTISTILDGPEKVVRYGALTLGDGSTTTSLTASNRCKGLTIICDSLLIKNAATLHMTARGARVDRSDDPFFPFIDFKIPNQITLSSDRVSLAKALAMIKANGWALWDHGTMQHIVALLNAFDWSVSQAGSVTLLSATGCGASAAMVYITSASAAAGNNGNAGANGGIGSGGSGGVWSNTAGQYTSSAKSGAGCPYGGGSGSGGFGNNQGLTLHGTPCSLYSGPAGAGGGICPWNNAYDTTVGDAVAGVAYGGGGSGNPYGKQGASTYAGQTDGGSGVGGKLVIICYGNITVQSGGKIEANGVAGGSGGASGYPGGGGSGGGHISLIYSGSYTNSGTVQAAGGSGGTGNVSGGNGGAGSVVTKTFTDMGW